MNKQYRPKGFKKCQLILKRMLASGIKDCVGPEDVENWSADEIDYFVANYERSWITNQRKPKKVQVQITAQPKIIIRRQA